MSPATVVGKLAGVDAGGAAAQDWLREQCAEYEFDLAGVVRLNGSLSAPVAADDATSLAQVLADGDHMLPLPKEPAAFPTCSRHVSYW